MPSLQRRVEIAPNRIGSTICRVLQQARGASIDGAAELDAIDGTPVLDIKPVIR